MEHVNRDLYPVKEAAQRLGIGRTTIYDLVNSGDLTIVKIGRRALVPAESLDAYIERLTAASV